MKSLLAFMKKEWMEQVRSGRLLILVIIFILLGIMNPAVAKLTPWLLEMMADSLKASGMTVTAVTVSAMDSWVQFFKNAPMGLIAFILLESSIFTKEYHSGTLVLALTKGLDRHKVVISKAIILTLLWTVCYWFCFTITFGYNTYFWDNSIAQNLFFFCHLLVAVWIIGGSFDRAVFHVVQLKHGCACRNRLYSSGIVFDWPNPESKGISSYSVDGRKFPYLRNGGGTVICYGNLHHRSFECGLFGNQLSCL